MTLVRAPAPRTGIDALRGRRVFGGERAADAVEVRWAGHEVVARRTRDGWEVDGRSTPAPATEALNDLVEGLLRLRAIDAFRPRDSARFGLDAPRGAIVLRRGARARRLTLGDMNAAGSAFYARLDDDRRVLQVGSGVASSLERVLYALGRQRPETG